MIYLGIDPGKSGGVAVIDSTFVDRVDATAWLGEADTRDWVEEHLASDRFALLEKVHAMPKQGVSSTFTFGANFGYWIGLLTVMRIPFELISPGTWQKAMGCLTHGDKNVSKAKAAQLFPHIKVTHAIADALLIAEFLRRRYYGKSTVGGDAQASS